MQTAPLHPSTDASPLSFRALSDSDIAPLQRLSSAIWWKHYPSVISEAQIAYMLELMYSEAALRKQMASGHRFYAAEIDGELAGFAAVEQQGIGEYFIHKFYVDTERHRAGIGRAMLAHIEALHAPRLLRLHVNCHNVLAINFYFKTGFIAAGTRVGDIGSGFVMDDLVMEKRFA
jgi:ribosomal protein S18 acetylase RimI-like enzyme